MKKRYFQKGQTLVELLLVIGLSAIILPALLTGLVAGRSGKAQQAQRLEAVALLKETEETVRNVRENDWNDFVAYQPSCPCHPEISGSSWILGAGSETVNGFTRSVVINNVLRDDDPLSPTYGAIVPSGGALDPSSKKIVITVSWGAPLPTSIQSAIYLMRLDNITYVETTEAEFNNGTKTGVAVTNTSGGEITLGAGGAGNWCAPTPPSGSMTLDLPKSGKANALTAIEDNAFATTGENASGVSFASIVGLDSNPPAPTIDAEFDGYKTNGVFGEEDYAYIATDNNSKEVVIINLNSVSSGKYQEEGHFDSPGPTNGESVYVSGSTGYMTAGNTLYSFDLTSKSGSRSQLGSVSLVGKGEKVVVNGIYAYVATDSTTMQLQIINVSNPSSMSVVGQASVSSNTAALDFDGVDDIVSIPDSTSLDLTSEGSLSAWVNLDSLPSVANDDYLIVGKQNGYSVDKVSYILFLDQSNSNKVSCGLSNLTSGTFTAGNTPSTGSWQHIVCTWDGSNVRVYQNGVQTGIGAQTVNAGVSTFPVEIGGVSADSLGDLDGKVDEVRIYNRALTPQEVAADSNAGILARLGNSPSSGLVSYWSLDEGSGQIVNDSASSNNGTRGGSSSSESNDPAWIAHTGHQGASDIFVNQAGDRAYLVTKNSTTNKEFFILDTSAQTGNRPLIGAYEANGMNPKGVTVVTGNKAIIAGTGEEEYQVIDITSESSPVRCGGLDVDAGINGVSSVLEIDGEAYSYIITGDANKEFQILGSGSGGTYTSSGDFISQTIPIPMPANNTSFNRFEVNVNRLSNTDIKFQVAAEDAIAGSCSGVTFNFVGDDGTSSTFFETSVTTGTEAFDYAIPTAINPGQCFRYKIFLSTTDSSQTPVFYDLTINHSP